MSRDYVHRRMSETMRAWQPFVSPAAEAATIYRQTWRRQDGSQVRTFEVLALDEHMAEEMGGIRLREKYNQNQMRWRLELNKPLERVSDKVKSILNAEDPDEEYLREKVFRERNDRKESKP